MWSLIKTEGRETCAIENANNRKRGAYLFYGKLLGILTAAGQNNKTSCAVNDAETFHKLFKGRTPPKPVAC